MFDISNQLITVDNLIKKTNENKIEWHTLETVRFEGGNYAEVLPAIAKSFDGFLDESIILSDSFVAPYKSGFLVILFLKGNSHNNYIPTTKLFIVRNRESSLEWFSDYGDLAIKSKIESLKISAQSYVYYYNANQKSIQDFINDD